MTFSNPRGLLSPQQISQLLKPINPKRVVEAQGHSHLAQYDVIAHLSRIFGFGNFDVELPEGKPSLIFEKERVDPKTGNPTNRWDVCYAALVRLTIRNEAGEHVATLENGSTGSAQNQGHSDAHDLAYKTAISVSTKRASTFLGDQYGLSLYNKGQLSALVVATMVGQEPVEDVQAGITEQVSLDDEGGAQE
jgi:hypothetical protein